MSLATRSGGGGPAALAPRLDGSIDGSTAAMLRLLRWWRAPLWVLALFTGAKSFRDNPILGSRRLNRAGLHASRVRVAHAVAGFRRKRIARAVPSHLRAQFDENGFVVVHDLLPADEFQRLAAAILQRRMDCRVQQQGGALTRRVAIGPELRRAIPGLQQLLSNALWRSLMAYVGSSRREPLYYIQTISTGGNQPPDPQSELHRDTFHPSLKAWLFLTDVDERECPLTYVAGSHRLSQARLKWEHQRSIDVLRNCDRLSQRGSLRVDPAELPGLGLPQPTRFAVPANTLVIADTCGFHARAVPECPSVRVEIWAYSRGSPFVPWTSGGLLSWAPIAQRQSQVLQKLLDLLDHWGVLKQHWVPGGARLPLEP